MKKFLSGLLAGVVCIGLAGCGEAQKPFPEAEVYEEVQKRIQATIDPYEVEYSFTAAAELSTDMYWFNVNIDIPEFTDLSKDEQYKLVSELDTQLNTTDVKGAIDLEWGDYRAWIVYEKVISGEDMYSLNIDDNNILNKNYKVYYNASSGEDLTISKFEAYVKENNVELTAKDVQYNMGNNLDELFTIKGTATISDYYNYGFRDIESTHFVMKVRPDGGTYSEEWYIYCNRESFEPVYDDVMNGSIYVEMVCKIPSGVYNSSQGNMARAVYITWK